MAQSLYDDTGKQSHSPTIKPAPEDTATAAAHDSIIISGEKVPHVGNYSAEADRLLTQCQ